MALGLELRADVGGAAVLPDDGAVHGLAGGAVPHHGGLALVGDADRGDVLRGKPRLLQRVAADHDGRGPDVLGLVLDPARGREMLREFLLRRGCDGDVAAKHHRARGCGALIDGQHERHERYFPEVRWVCRRPRQADWNGKVNMGGRRFSLPGKRSRRGAGDAAAGAGDDGDLPSETERGEFRGQFSLPVIASEAKQSILPRKDRMDCFVADAPRNDSELSFRDGPKD